MNCNLCPRGCNVNRATTVGRCGVSEIITVSRAALHKWEEPCVSGTNGSGTIFFSGCPLGCDFCQNFSISNKVVGKQIQPNRLYDIMFELKSNGAHNINLVTADHFALQLAPVIKRAKQDGLGIPVVLNTSSYITKSTLSLLDSFIDVYLADFKFMSPALSQKYCAAPDYPDVVKESIDFMVQHHNKPIFENGLIKSGVIVRVLIMPNNLIDAKRIIKYLCDRYGDKIIISVMSQYTPMPNCKHTELSRPINECEYTSIKKYLASFDIKYGYLQEFGSNGTKYIPDFSNFEGV